MINRIKNDGLAVRSLLGGVALWAFFGIFWGGCTQSDRLTAGEWTLEYDEASDGIDIRKGSKLIYDNVYASYRLADSIVTTRSYGAKRIATEKIEDALGEGIRYKVTYTDDRLPDLVQFFYVYSGKDYILTDFVLEKASGVASNYMAPVNVDRMPEVLPGGGDNRALFVPFDNDCRIRYRSHPLVFDTLTSYEVTAIFDNDTREAIVTGSVEHDAWKTGITIGKGNIYNVT